MDSLLPFVTIGWLAKNVAADRAMPTPLPFPFHVLRWLRCGRTGPIQRVSSWPSPGVGPMIPRGLARGQASLCKSGLGRSLSVRGNQLCKWGAADSGHSSVATSLKQKQQIETEGRERGGKGNGTASSSIFFILSSVSSSSSSSSSSFPMERFTDQVRLMIPFRPASAPYRLIVTRFQVQFRRVRKGRHFFLSFFLEKFLVHFFCVCVEEEKEEEEEEDDDDEKKGMGEMGEGERKRRRKIYLKKKEKKSTRANNRWPLVSLFKRLIGANRKHLTKELWILTAFSPLPRPPFHAFWLFFPTRAWYGKLQITHRWGSD